MKIKFYTVTVLFLISLPLSAQLQSKLYFGIKPIDLINGTLKFSFINADNEIVEINETIIGLAFDPLFGFGLLIPFSDPLSDKNPFFIDISFDYAFHPELSLYFSISTYNFNIGVDYIMNLNILNLGIGLQGNIGLLDIYRQTGVSYYISIDTESGTSSDVKGSGLSISNFFVGINPIIFFGFPLSTSTTLYIEGGYNINLLNLILPYKFTFSFNNIQDSTIPYNLSGITVKLGARYK